MPLFAIDTTLTFRHTYVVEAENLSDAQTAVAKRDSVEGDYYFDEVTQRYLGETITSGKEITKEEFDAMLTELAKDEMEVSSHWMGDKLIHRVIY